MNDLDRKIAELKGMAKDGRAIHIDAVTGPFWSTSDSKALELVDELGDPLFFIERYGKPGEKRWKAHFALPYSEFLEQRGDRKLYRTAYFDAIGEGATRPEAICRAYIAAVEFLKSRGNPA